MSYRVLPGMALCLVMSSAGAHHGWNWADEGQTRITGIVRNVQMAPPHPRLDVETTDSGVWRVELGNPRQTRAAGFVEGSAKIGDRISATGNRASDHSEKRMKAVQITVGDKTYDIYPDRIQRSR